MNRQELKKEIERLGFLDYVDDINVDKVRDELIRNIVEKKAFFFPAGNNHENIDGRIFSFDPENLTEGGAIDLFNEIRPSIEKAGLKINQVDQVFKFIPNSGIPDYRLIVNQHTCNLGVKTFLIFLLPGKVAKKFSLFLDKLLKRGKIKERIYFMNDSCSDTEIAFLTPDQARFINSLGLNPKDKVYKISNLIIWRPVFQIMGLIFKAIFKRKPKNA